MAWRCRFLTARRSQRGHVIAEKCAPDTLVDFHTGTGPEHSVQVRDAVRAAGVPLLVWGKTVYNADGTARTLGSTTGGPAEPAPFE